MYFLICHLSHWSSWESSTNTGKTGLKPAYMRLGLPKHLALLKSWVMPINSTNEVGKLD